MLSKAHSLIHTPTRRLARWLDRWRDALGAALRAGQFRMTHDGAAIVFDDVRLQGMFFYPERAGSREMVFAPNMVVDQGIMKTLGVMFKAETPITAWYLSMFSGVTPPTAGLTAANVAATLGEITSTTEGFSNVTRPAWTPGTVVANVVNNYDAMATFNVVATTTITATGGFLVSSDVRGGGSGTLWSAALWPSSRELHNGEPFKLGYQTSLTD